MIRTVAKQGSIDRRGLMHESVTSLPSESAPAGCSGERQSGPLLLDVIEYKRHPLHLNHVREVSKTPHPAGLTRGQDSGRPVLATELRHRPPQQAEHLPRAHRGPARRRPRGDAGPRRAHAQGGRRPAGHDHRGPDLRVRARPRLGRGGHCQRPPAGHGVATASAAGKVALPSAAIASVRRATCASS